MKGKCAAELWIKQVMGFFEKEYLSIVYLIETSMLAPLRVCTESSGSANCRLALPYVHSQ